MFKKLKFSIILATAILLSGCAGVGGSGVNNAFSEQQVTSQAQQFFQTHPEYLKSPKAEAELFTLFKAEVQYEHNKNKSMYDVLDAAHNKLKMLSNFKADRTVRS